MEAIESGADVPPAVLKDAVGLVRSGGVKLLAYNGQTEGPQTRALKDAATAAGVPVLDFSETLPEGNHVPAVDGGQCGRHRQDPVLTGSGGRPPAPAAGLRLSRKTA